LNTKIINKFLLISVILPALFFFINCKADRENKDAEGKTGVVIKSDTMKPVSTDSGKIFKLPEDAFKLHFNSIVVDSHNDYLYQVFKRGADFGNKDGFTQSGLPRFKEGGLSLQFFAIWIPASEERRAYAFANEQAERLKKAEKEHSEEFAIAYSYEDFVKIHESGKFCGMMGIEDGAAVMTDLKNVDRLYDTGVRYIGLTWNKSNAIGSSAHDESDGRKTKGLTEFGKKVVQRMEELGMMIDVSHSGESTFWDIMENTKGPIIASHSNCYSLNPHYRNLTDAQIKAIAERGGVIMVNFLDDFINENGKGSRVKNYNDRYKRELENIYNENSGDLIAFNKKRYEFIIEHPIKGGTTLDDLIAHIDYIKNLVGVDYIGLGSDFDGGITPPVEIYDATCYPIITQRLAEKGYTEQDIRKILGLNFLRVLKQVCSKK
jgi:membrane dipeptidase